jgi:cytochrome bd-type quinol oxidase subunit 2
MKQRDPIIVFLLSIITLGIYGWYWLVATKNELNVKNKEQPHIPTAWIWLIPFFGFIWWLWVYSEGVDKRTKGACSQVIAFILIFLLSIIGIAILQDFFNKVKR